MKCSWIWKPAIATSRAEALTMIPAGTGLTNMGERYFQICAYCKKNAYEYLVTPKPGMIITPYQVRHADNPRPTEPITCQACGQPVKGQHLVPEYLRIKHDSDESEDTIHIDFGQGP